MTRVRVLVLVLASIVVSGCQSLVDSLEAPDVELARVRLAEADLSSQQFVLDFTVANPNAIALPVSAINYQIELGGVSLASGNTPRSFRVPAGGNGAFSLTVEMSLVESLRLLGTRVLAGGETRLDYNIGGSVALDLPLVRPLPFSATGSVDVGGRN